MSCTTYAELHKDADYFTISRDHGFRSPAKTDILNNHEDRSHDEVPAPLIPDFSKYPL